MVKVTLGIIIFLCMSSVFADKNRCTSKVNGYKVVKNSVYPFVIDKEGACFFAFYTQNPDPIVDVKGDGNLGDALWYAYYKIDSSSTIYEFPKPLDLDWGNVCSIEAVSFYPMHGGTKRDVTVIGSCNKQNARNYTFPFVFIWQGDRYNLDESVYSNLYGMISLTISDIRSYIKSPDTCYKILEGRSDLNGEGRITCD